MNLQNINAQFPYLLSGIDLERETMKHIRQLGLREKQVSSHSDQKAVATPAYRIPNDKVFALDSSSGRPRYGRSRLHELGRLAFYFRVFLNSFNSNLKRG